MPATPLDLELDGVRAVVTGGSKGIGLAVAERLTGEGARVLIVGRDPDALEAAAADLGADVLVCDVTAEDADAQVVAAADARLGGIDVLVNNAGGSFIRSLAELTDADWQAQWEINVMGPMRLMRAIAPRMAAQGHGRIVNVASSAGKRPSRNNVAYTVTKAAELALSRMFSEEFGPQGVNVNAVAPGATASSLWLGDGGMAEQSARVNEITRDEAIAKQTSRIPQGRFATPQEIADVIVFLCSVRSGAVSGAAWSVDGGTVQSFV